MVYGRCVKAFWGAVGNGGYYLCGDKDNAAQSEDPAQGVVICSKFITFAVTKTTEMTLRKGTVMLWFAQNSLPLRWQRQLTVRDSLYKASCDLLKIHYLCGDKDNAWIKTKIIMRLWFAQNSLPLRWQRQLSANNASASRSCDLLKIHYLCGDKDNQTSVKLTKQLVVICSKFITFAVTKTTRWHLQRLKLELWFAQNSLPLRWQRQLYLRFLEYESSCDLLKIHYLCGDKDNCR